METFHWTYSMDYVLSLHGCIIVAHGPLWWLELKSVVSCFSSPRNALYAVKFTAGFVALAICTVFNPLLLQSSLPSVLSIGHLSSISIVLLCLSSADFISRSYLLPLASLLRCPWLAQLQLLVYPPYSSLLLLSLSGLINVTWHCIKRFLLNWKLSW